MRKPEELKKAAQMAVEKFGKIDFVVCGEFRSHREREREWKKGLGAEREGFVFGWIGAAGNL